MNNRKYACAVVGCFSSVALLAAACSNSGNPPANSPSSTDSKNPSAAAAAAGPLGKYSPPIDVRAVRGINGSFKFPQGEDISNNLWAKTYKEEYGINLTYDWVADNSGGNESAYNKKLNLMIASGQLPDIVAVNSKQFKQLAEDGKLADLTEAFEKFATPYTKDVAKQDGGMAMSSATINGKLLAIPGFNGNITNANVVWIRSDWMKKLNLPEPKTMQDLFAIMEAFATKDPNGDGGKGVIGLAANKNIYDGFADLLGFFNGYHAYPNGMWIKDDAGQLVYGGIQKEMKPALAKLQELYKSGLIDKEFGAKDAAKEAELFGQNKLGITFGANSNPYYPFDDARKRNPEMDWKAYPIPSIDDKPARPAVGFPISTYYVVNKNFKHPEVVVKMFNANFEKFFGKTGDWNTWGVTKDRLEAFKWPFVYGFPPDKDVPGRYEALKKAIETNDPSAMNGEQKADFDAYQAYKNGDQTKWATVRQAGPTDSSFAVLNHYKQNNLLYTNEYRSSLQTDTMTLKWSTLLNLEKEMITKIILGASLDEFDKFVENWKKSGGDQITKEVNDWAANSKK
ncbi:extracellular solute-binding protein [Paenibacillus oleatilyticus]|uniref:extracellular solute-binding protein n=1 Tax=Paenibacillus oleatilyticus TaxID=2594886 RepID=UPI001C1FEC6D|nr:extracellular solute-binding protein [Paenibacillus oleatilyticus]MBU7316595.1 extracellular solute-binding protein [Paenibacillus oleatilyticus]